MNLEEKQSKDTENSIKELDKLKQLKDAMVKVGEHNGAVMGKMLLAMTSHMAEVMGQQNEQITRLKNTMVTNGQQQLENLNVMRENTQEMRTLADKSYVVSTELYNKTIEFHNNMAQSSARQLFCLTTIRACRICANPLTSSWNRWQIISASPVVVS